MPLCPPQIPHGLIRDRTRASAVGGQRLSAWGMARPRRTSWLHGCSVSWIPVGLCTLHSRHIWLNLWRRNEMVCNDQKYKSIIVREGAFLWKAMTPSV
jgi:hypothetical protein